MNLNKKICLVIILTILTIILSVFISASDYDNTKIFMKGNHINPEKGISKSAIDLVQSRGLDKTTHLLVQFKHDLSNAEKQKLERLGIKLVAYIPYNAWYVSVPNNVFSNLTDKDFINAVDVIIPDYKKSPNVKEKKFGDWALNEKGDVYLTVKFHKDIELDNVASLVNQVGGKAIN